MAPELTSAEALDACGALLALRTGASSQEILREFLRLRQDCLRSRAALGRSESARTAVCTLLRTVMSTVAAISEVFVGSGEGGTGTLQQFVERTASDTAEPSVLLLGQSSFAHLFITCLWACYRVIVRFNSMRILFVS